MTGTLFRLELLNSRDDWRPRRHIIPDTLLVDRETRLQVSAPGLSTTKRFTCGTLDFENAGRRIFDGAIEAKFPLDARPVKVE
jgi:hypothetical protein